MVHLLDRFAGSSGDRGSGVAVDGAGQQSRSPETGVGANRRCEEEPERMNVAPLPITQSSSSG